MKSRKIWIGVGIAAIIFVVWMWIAYRGDRNRAPILEETIPTRMDVPADTVVPEKDSANIPENVAIPEVVVPAAPEAESNFRVFDLMVKGDKFIPDTVAVNVGDTVHINISAADKSYDLVQPDYGFKVVLPKGETKVLEFQATNDGKYVLYCEKCGGPENGPVGYIIVVKK